MPHSMLELAFKEETLMGIKAAQLAEMRDSIRELASDERCDIEISDSMFELTDDDMEFFKPKSQRTVKSDDGGFKKAPQLDMPRNLTDKVREKVEAYKKVLRS